MSPEVENGKMTELVHNTSSNLDLYLTGFVFSTCLHIFIDELVPGSLATWLEHATPNLRDCWSHFIDGWGRLRIFLCLFVFSFQIICMVLLKIYEWFVGMLLGFRGRNVLLLTTWSSQ